MTYCCGLLLKNGVAMIADTRTNAGVDNISVFRKLHTFVQPGAHAFAIATAGSLSVTQSALSLLREGCVNPETGALETLESQTSMFRLAQFVGHALKKVTDEVRASLQSTNIDYGATVLLGGQIAGGPPRLFLIYGVGNFIECGPDSPFLQIGEHKYGKPILDRALSFHTDLYEGLKLGLISFEMTLRSNLAVGAPLDCVVIRTDALDCELEHRVEPDEPYFRELGDTWSATMREGPRRIPAPPYGAAGVRPLAETTPVADRLAPAAPEFV